VSHHLDHLFIPFPDPTVKLYLKCGILHSHTCLLAFNLHVQSVYVY
jgi:hypothetical protein